MTTVEGVGDVRTGLHAVQVGTRIGIMKPGGCFTKTKIDFKLDLIMAGHSCHWLLSLLVSQF